MSSSDKQRRDAAVDAFAEAMKRRLDQKADEGKTGWDGEYPSYMLLNEMTDDIHLIRLALCSGAIGPTAISERLAVDLANRAMMIWYRDQAK